MTPAPPRPETPPLVRILALDMLTTVMGDLPAGVVATARFTDLDSDLLARIKPDRIILPLLAPGHDATAVVERLQEIGFCGLITVVALQLPNARMVEAELRALGPGARLTLLTP